MLPQNAVRYAGVARRWLRGGTLLLTAVWAMWAWAGPPFVTDDPDPVELHHWEVYLASMTTNTAEGDSGTLPHVEINNGFAPNLQWHIIMPYAFQSSADAHTAHGYGDTELGVKYRFLPEDTEHPMVGVFPLLELPTGSATRGLGSGHVQLFLPVWVEQTWGSWTSYGGGGYQLNPGAGNRDNWLLGWAVQKELIHKLTLGGELFYHSPATTNTDDQLNYNVGGQYDVNEEYHLLFSAGSSLHGDVRFMDYLGVQWTFGPRNAASEDAHGS
jgi:hypothetical protein